MKCGCRTWGVMLRLNRDLICRLIPGVWHRPDPVTGWAPTGYGTRAATAQVTARAVRASSVPLEPAAHAGPDAKVRGSPQRFAGTNRFEAHRRLVLLANRPQHAFYQRPSVLFHPLFLMARG